MGLPRDGCFGRGRGTGYAWRHRGTLLKGWASVVAAGTVLLVAALLTLWGVALASLVARCRSVHRDNGRDERR